MKGTLGYTVSMKSGDYSEYADADRHQNQRDRKHERAKIDRVMRGNRSVFEIQKAIAKRGKRAKGEKNV